MVESFIDDCLCWIDPQNEENAKERGCFNLLSPGYWDKYLNTKTVSPTHELLVGFNE